MQAGDSSLQKKLTNLLSIQVTYMKRHHPASPTSAQPTLQECQGTEFVRTNIKNQTEYHI